MRRQLRLRSFAVAGFGVLGGLVTGAILSALVVELVVLTAGAATPEPPLRLALGWPVVALGLVFLVALGGILVGTFTRRAFLARSAGRHVEVGA